MISIDVRSDEVLNFFDRFRSQAPFGISVGINRLAELGMAAAGQGIKSRMTVRVPGFVLPPIQLPNSARATKDRLYAVADIAYGDDPKSIGARRRAILAKFEDGGEKRSADPNYPIAIPTKALRPTPGTLVPRQMYPRNLVGAFGKTGAFVGLTSGKRGKKRQGAGQSSYFIINPTQQLGAKPSAYGLYERYGPRPNQFRMIWAFRTKIPIPPLLHYQEDITRTVNENYVAELNAAMDFAIATAK